MKMLDSRKGFTLLEVLIAFIILAVGLLGLAALQIIAIKANAFSKEMTQASAIAQAKLEELKNLPFSDVKLHPTDSPGSSDCDDPNLCCLEEQDCHPFPNESEDWYQEEIKGVTYMIRHKVWENTPSNGMRKVKLWVEWVGTTAEQPQRHLATFTTIVYE